MRFITMLTILLAVASTAQGQNAPDFTVTDTDGQTHHLYADYLNQGKSVLIKVFFTTCPPCNSIAPLMEPLYQEWGAGEYDVEFFDLSDKSFDTNPLVSAYKANYGHTYPSAGSEGGSIAAVTPYKNGLFGPWSGTPTFIVIAPDGSVQFDVSGPGNQATIAAIDAALAATGAVKPGEEEVPVIVGGAVTFLQGSTGVGQTIVEILDGNGHVIEDDTTNASGAFALSVLQSEVQPDWIVRARKSGNPVNGVSAIDLLLIQKHLIQLELLTDPLKKLAADANRSSTLSVLDIVTLTKLLLGKITEFPGGESWILFPADTALDAPGQHPPVIPSYVIPLVDILSGARNPHFIAIKKGDVNGSATP